MLFSPEVEQRRGVAHVACAAWPGPFGSDDRLLLEAGEHVMSQADRDLHRLGEFLDSPRCGRDEESLGEHAGLAGQSRSSMALPAQPRLASSLEMDKEPWELDVRVSEPVDGRNAILLENLPRLRRRLPCDEQEGPLGVCMGLLHDLPSSGGICTSLDLNSDSLLLAGVPDYRVSAAAWAGRLGGNCQARDLPQHAQGVSLKRPLNFHSFSLIHSDSEYTIYSE